MPEPSQARAWHLAPETICAVGQALLAKAGAPPDHARIVMEHLIVANAMGLDSHGIMRLPQYLAEIETGLIDPRAEPVIIDTAPACLAVEGRRGFGQVVGMRMVEALIPLARLSGIALAKGHQLGHTGRVGAYAQAFAEAGLIGLAVCNGAPSGHWVAPFGGREGRISTNPIAVAWPVEGEPAVVADFSTAMAPEGVIRVLRERGLEAPESYLRDPEGRPSRDPKVLYASPRGALQALGGPLGYRGTALALFVEVLTTLLNGEAVDDRRRTGTDMTLLAIAPPAGFQSLARGLSEHIRATPPLEASRPVLMPGDREIAAAARKTIRIDQQSWIAITKAARSAGLAMPDAVPEPSPRSPEAETSEGVNRGLE